jgi:5-methyltetrahydrofolate--homocysteine methyltransferase
MTLLEKIATGRIILSDGALGTMLQSKGLQPDECPELWNVTHRNEVSEIARSYFDAGSEIVTTNSFGGNVFKLSFYGLEDRVAELNQRAAEIVREAAGRERHVAGSIGPSSKMLLMGDVTEEELYNAFREQAVALEKGGADIIIIETMTAIDEASLAVKAARENTSATVIVTMTFSGTPDGEYRTMMGVSPKEMVDSMKEAGAHIIGSNCGNGIKEMTGVARAIREADKNIPLIIQANAGLPEYVDGKTIFRESPEMMASFVPELIKTGVNIIGGCCGTTPEHIRGMRRMTEGT